MSGTLEGVREGTVVAALITGPIVRVFSSHIGFIERWLTSGTPHAAEVQELKADRPVVITIGRQYGSGGHMIGRLVAEHLQLPFYDNQLITLAAQESGFSEKFVSEKEQNMPSSLLYQMIYADYESPMHRSLSPDDALFVAQGRVMLKLARQGSCVIMGRCADYLLRDDADCLRVFLHADNESLYKRAQEQYGLSKDEVADKVDSVNNSRREHYRHFTNRTWDDANNYDISLDTGKMSDEMVCRMIEDAYKERIAHNQNRGQKRKP